MRHAITKGFCATLLLSASLISHGEDIDLFLGATTASSTDMPNVLFIVDNTANWNTAFSNEIAALVSTLTSLPPDKFRVGIMFAAETGSGNNNIDGGYVRAAIRPMTNINKAAYQGLLLSLDKQSDKGNGGASSLVMAEAWRYLSGGVPHAGNGKVKADYTGNTSGTTMEKFVHALPGNALNSKTATSYNAPGASDCEKNYIIYISNGAPQDNDTTIKKSESMLSAAGGSIEKISVSPVGSEANPIDEWARFMRDSNKKVVTYTIDVDPATTGNGPGWSAVLKSMANAGGGKYFAASSGNAGAAIADATSKALSEIQSVNSVFASVSLPISVNTQGSHLNHVYIGMFRPDGSNLPRWPGNLKQYKLDYINNELKLVDADGSSAINGLTGFVAECARSFWTPTATDSYWSFQPQGACIPPAGADSNLYKNSNRPDGNIVEKGGQAYVTRTYAGRSIKTCSSTFSSCTALTDFNTTNVSASDLGVSAAERDSLLNWARGADTGDENLNLNMTEIRPSVHGDVVHSRPVAINYGTDSAPSIVVFYGANDGMLRAANGNRTGDIIADGNTYPAGAELWSFVAPESYGLFKRLRDNSTQILNPNNTNGLPKPYGMDGPLTAWQNGSNAWLYATMRRGGRAIYAFDVSAPANPVLKWKRGCPGNFSTSGTVSDVDCSTGFAGIGQTWSAPKVVRASGYVGGSSALLVMGGGNDPCEDTDPQTCTAAGYFPKGNVIYVMDAASGALQKSLPVSRSVVADIAVIPDPATGLASFAYAVDLGGNVYRINIGSSAPSAWTITKIASLGCDSVATVCTNNRKFMFAPDVVLDNGIYYLMVGSGDREKPLLSYASASTVTNRFFMVKDDPASSTWLSSETGNCASQSVICQNSLLQITGSTNPSSAELGSKKGWYLTLASSERVVTSAITLYGFVTFSTNQPQPITATSCNANLGFSRVYNISYLNAAPATGSARFNRIIGDGLPPSPVAGLVTLDNGRTVPFVIGASGKSPLEVTQGTSSPGSSMQLPKGRVYWYVQQ